MSSGPVELLAGQFAENRSTGEIRAAMTELARHGKVRIVDILFAQKDDEGRVRTLEINDLGDNDHAVFDPVASDVTDRLTEEDAHGLLNALPNGSSSALMLFENVWATRIADDVANAGGNVVLSERIPRSVIEQAVAA
jgi:Family of unknown function (DUF6325)